MSTAGRTIRIAVTLLTGALLAAGSLWGSEQHFPFGPFSMFAQPHPADAPVAVPRIEATTVDGASIILDARQTGWSRGELERRRDLIAADPALLREAVEAYLRHDAGAAELREVRYVLRWHEVAASRPTGSYRDEVVASWAVPRRGRP